LRQPLGWPPSRSSRTGHRQAWYAASTGKQYGAIYWHIAVLSLHARQKVHYKYGSSASRNTTLSVYTPAGITPSALASRRPSTTMIFKFSWRPAREAPRYNCPCENYLAPKGKAAQFLVLVLHNILQGPINSFKANQCCMGASSQMMTTASRMSAARSLLTDMLHYDSASKLPTGILKRKCAVRPPSSKNAAMPEEAPGRASFPCALTAESMHPYVKVLPVHQARQRKRHSLGGGRAELGQPAAIPAS
jgi:hypothetical protein